MAEGIKDYSVYALHMHLYDESRYRFLKTLDSPFGSVSDLDAWIARLAACTCLMGRSPEAGAEYMEELVTGLLIEQVLGGLQLRDLPAKMDDRIARLLGTIRRRPAEAWSVTRMAESCNLSVSRFRQLFVACTSTSPKKHVQRVRLSLARSLLVTKPDLTVEQVADKVGISDARYFHAIYKARFGETPRQRSPYP
jgi:transcriptional regulator GlxA family with amidase domain